MKYVQGGEEDWIPAVRRRKRSGGGSDDGGELKEGVFRLAEAVRRANLVQYEIGKNIPEFTYGGEQ